jgi:hypothetical protein
MVNLSAHKKLHTNKLFVQLLFWGVTLVMLITRYASLYTYSGADDLHYAFLSSKMLHGSYNIFFENDIFSARTLVIAYQAVWFKLFGINDFTMCMPSLSLLILLAWVVCFKCNLQRNIYTIVLGSSLIYFNPVVSRSTLGNLPDVYIALIALFTVLLIKKSSNSNLKHKNIGWGIIAGLLLIAGLFVKESIVLIYAGTAALLVYYRKKVSTYFILALATTFLISVIGYLCFYNINTGNFFYHFVQIKNSGYFNNCSYGCLPKIHLVKRLTVTVPFGVIIKEAYPLLLLIPALLAYRKHLNADTGFWKIVLASLTFLSLYFPFSIFPYVPLCHDMRQFFFLFPFASILYLVYLQQVFQSAQNFKSISIISAVVFTIVVLLQVLFTPYNKAGIICGGLLALLFIVNAFLNKKLQTALLYLIVPVVLWLSIAYPLYKKPHQGYASLKTLHKTLSKQTSYAADTYYFINNDTKTHFALINKFNDAQQFFNLDTVQRGFKPFIKYQSEIALTKPGGYQKGWLIVSDDYFENMSSVKITSIKQLLAGKYFSVTVSNTSAYYLTSAETLEKIMHIINSNNAVSNCN